MWANFSALNRVVDVKHLHIGFAVFQGLYLMRATRYEASEEFLVVLDEHHDTNRARISFS